MSMKWIQRIAAAGGATVIAVTLVGTAASADPATPNPSAGHSFDVQKVCAQRIPKLSDRATKLITRITGGPEVAGSSANLRARAEKAKTAGNPAEADWLDGKAQHRDDRLDLLKKAVAQLDAYKQKYCAK
ncbi:hypothetical protein [Actinocrispum wychmicini]|uniref:Secreted protein n=1 Tax=Actinocrispum wychmicini TaxID=1213861 RepID=A0A4R2JH33_9PSEU|nr:hypothetical protein [Actinocrispum wychmicini]TCO58364.1 hypothetical protein EV192_105431 [Actinocrispum wychmicini]